MKIRLGIIKTPLIKLFIKIYDVNMDEAVRKQAEEYTNFNDFFTRELDKKARPITFFKDYFLSPCDGCLSVFGRINNGVLIQAKNRTYALNALLASNVDAGREFEQGDFHVIYLSPRDYHRVHMPIKGMVKKMTYVPGSLFSVNPNTVSQVDSLFARNERLIIYFQTSRGNTFALIMVGAIFVGSINTKWQGQITPPYSKKIQHWQYQKKIEFEGGEEIANFNMGSTVIILTEKDALAIEDALEPNAMVKMGQILGKYR